MDRQRSASASVSAVMLRGEAVAPVKTDRQSVRSQCLPWMCSFPVCMSRLQTDPALLAGSTGCNMTLKELLSLHGFRLLDHSHPALFLDRRQLLWSSDVKKDLPA